VIDVAGTELFNAAQVIDVAPCFRLEVLPNRDSLSYATAYALPLIRGFELFLSFCGNHSHSSFVLHLAM
jgi:hypothetical protein